MSQASDLLATDAQLDALADRLTSKVKDTVHGLIPRYFRTVAASVRDLRIDGDGRLHARQSTSSVQSALQSGAEPILTAGRGLVAGLGQMAGLAVKGLEQAGLRPRLKESSLQAFATVKTAALDQLVTLIINDALNVTYMAVASKQQREELLVEIREVLDGAAGRIASWADTTLLEYSQFLVGSSHPNASAYLYSGPIDARCRPFCLDKVGKVWSRKLIDQFDNRITPNTFLTRGGYNCRHLWRPVTDRALVALVDTGKYVSEDVRARVIAARTAQKIKSKSKVTRTA
jgi:hypothetical protein